MRPGDIVQARLAENVMELNLVPNGDEIKLMWRSGAGSWSGPVHLDKKRLRKRARDVRSVLDSLTKYMIKNPTLTEEYDSQWRLYRTILTNLRRRGQSLCHAIFPYTDSTARDLLEQICPQDLDSHSSNRAVHSSLRIHCSDNEVAIPFGFIYRFDHPLPAVSHVAKPSIDDFSEFWMVRYDLELLTAPSESAKHQPRIRPDSFRSLYALDKEEVNKARNYLGEYEKKLKKLTMIEFKERNDWESAECVFSQLGEWNSVVFVVAHSDGDRLNLGDSEIDSDQFAHMMFGRNVEDCERLIILNCCNSAAGEDNCSLLQAVSERGCGGLIGTESEILNVHAIRCGTRLMWGLCAEGLSLGKAFRNMQEDIDLFPHSLLYSCYADRGFALESPLRELTVQD